MGCAPSCKKAATVEHAELIAQLRPVGSGLPLPEGWVAEEIRWNGQRIELAHDARLDVARLDRGSVSIQRRDAEGWRCIGTDQEGAGLWVRDGRRLALARLQRLRAADAGVPTLYVA